MCIVNSESNHESQTTNHKIIIESDRKKAIELALDQADDGDIVLIAGKGHEDYQIIGKTKIHFSDKEIAEQYLKDRID